MKRDLLPSQIGDHVTRALDECFERGVNTGRRIGLSAAADYIRKNPNTTAADLIVIFERMKYENV